MKKGFTIIEIIISISIIIIVGISTTFFIFNNKQNEDLENLTKKVLEAASMYASIETDNNGNLLINEIKNGKKGVQIPLNNLVKKGYIEESQSKKIQELAHEENYYIMLLDGSPAGTNYCEEGEIFTLASWNFEDKDIYLCNRNKVDDFLNPIDSLKKIRVDADITKYAITNDENGLFILFDETTKNVYSYYRGKVDNNYLELGADNTTGNKLIWRILWYKDTNRMKLILNEEVPLTITSKNGTVHNINIGDEIIRYNNQYDSSANEVIILNPTITSYLYDEGGRWDKEYFNVTFTSNQEMNSIIPVDYYDSSMTNSNNYYYQSLNNWYSKTNLNNFSFIKNDNFCTNNYEEEDSGGNYIHINTKANDTFSCKSGFGNKISYEINNYENSSYVGYITYGEAIRAGLVYAGTTDNYNIVTTGSFLLSDSSKAYPIERISEYNNEKNTNTSFLDIYSRVNYIANKGILTGVFYKEYKYSTNSAYWPYYTIIKPDTEIDASTKPKRNDILLEKCINMGSGNHITRKYTYFRVNSVKPAIVVDTTNLKLSGSGTVSDPYKLVDKQ